MDVKTALAFVLIGFFGFIQPFGPRVGPYDIVIEKLELCENQGSGKIAFKTRITNAGKGKYIYKENFTLGVPFDENIKQTVEVQKWGNGGWRPKFIEFKVKNCEEMWRIIGDFLKSLMKSAGVTVEKCPVPAGNYTADHWQVEFSVERTAPVLEYGRYRGILQFFYKQELAGCYVVYGEAVPKSPGQTRALSNT